MCNRFAVGFCMKDDATWSCYRESIVNSDVKTTGYNVYNM